MVKKNEADCKEGDRRRGAILDEVFRKGFCGKVVPEQHLNEVSEKARQASR